MTTTHTTAHITSRAWALRLVEFFIGLLFGLGLIISGMTQPSKVLGFLDIFGLWDPSLIFVMAGAIAIGFFAFIWAKPRKTSLMGEAICLPHTRQIDRRLLLGSLFFGAGWGLAGYCPGPAVVSMAAGQIQALVFTLAMLVGMGVFALWDGRQAK